MKKYRVSLIGTGGISRAHASAIQSNEERLEWVGIADLVPEKLSAFAETHGIDKSFHYTDSARMLAEQKPDIVLICTPPQSHCSLSVQALEAGAWVLCEKPLCGSLAQLDRIQEAEEHTGNFCSSVFQWRIGSGARHLRDLARSGALGKPLVAECLTNWYRPPSYYEVPWRGKWKTELGGPTMGHGIHAMDLFLFLMGEWEEVRAMIGKLDRDIEVEDVSMALVRFAGGAMGNVVNSILSPRQESYLRFDFQRATVEGRGLYRFNNDSWTFSSAPGVEEDEFAKWSEIGEDVPSSHDAQLAALIASRDAGERPLVSGAEARRTLEFLTALYKAAITGEPVGRGSILPGDPFYQTIHGGKQPDCL